MHTNFSGHTNSIPKRPVILVTATNLIIDENFAEFQGCVDISWEYNIKVSKKISLGTIPSLLLDQTEPVLEPEFGYPDKYQCFLVIPKEMVSKVRFLMNQNKTLIPTNAQLEC